MESPTVEEIVVVYDTRFELKRANATRTGTATNRLILRPSNGQWLIHGITSTISP